MKRTFVMCGAWVSAALLSGCLFTTNAGPTNPGEDIGTGSDGGSDGGLDGGSDGGSDGGQVGSCEDTTCSFSGQCVETSEVLEGYVCECDEGYTGVECAECDFGYERLDGECVRPQGLCFEVACLPGSECDEETGECTCPDGSPVGEDGECVGICDGPENPCLDTEACVDVGSGVAECVTPWDTCEGVRGTDVDFEEGEYVLYYERDPEQPWVAYCHEAEPRRFVEYLTLTVGSEFDNRFEEHHYDSTTSYTRVRVNPLNLRVDTRDARFATTTPLRGPRFTEPGGETNIYFGTVGSCGGESNGAGDPPGRGRVNLTGTPFFVDDEFLASGDCGVGDAVFSARRQIVDLTGTGGCGFLASSQLAMREGNICPTDPGRARVPDMTGGSQALLRLGYDANLFDPPPER